MASEETKGQISDEKLLEQAKARFKLASEADQKQRGREKDDLRFQVPDCQWDEAAKQARLGTGNDGVPIPARPMLSINRLKQPIQIVLNQERAAHLGVSIQPLSADAEKETAEKLEGIYRSIERDSQAHIARSWAFSRAVKCGRGYYRVNTQYDETTDSPFDQVITIERILHQDSVYLDPSAERPDCADGNFGFIASWVSLSDFKAEYPDAEISRTDDHFFSDLVNESPEWIKGDGESRAVLVVEYFYKIKRFEEVKAKGTHLKRKRELVDVKWAKLTGWEVLERGDWAGHYIPIIPAIGEELHPFDAERRWAGIITDSKDAQRMYNYAASSAVEIAALEPKAPFIGVEGQFEGHEDKWGSANTRNHPYLEYRNVSLNGTAAPAPARMQIDVGRLGPSMQLLQQADQFLQVTTATYDPSLGRLSSREKSGRAIMALQQQGDEGNSHYMHNLADISMNYEARVVLDLIPTIYDREGRMVRTLDEEDRTESVMLNRRHYMDPRTKRPVPLGPDQQPPMPPPGPAGPPNGAPATPMPGSPQPTPLPPAPPKVQHYDLRKGIYSVAVSIGKTRQSALQEGAEEIGQILTAQPNLMPILGPLYFKYRDFPGAKEISDMLGKMRDKQFPFLAEGDEGGQPTVEQAMAKAQALEQQLQAMGQQLQAAMKAIETEQIKTQATLAKAQIDAQAGLQKASMDNETKVTVAQIQQETQVMLKALMAKLEAIEGAKGRAHESVEAEADREQEALMAVATPALAVPEWKGANTEPLETPEGGKEI